MKTQWYGVVREELKATATEMKVYANEREAQLRAELAGVEYPSLAPFVVVPLTLAPAA